MLVTLDSAKRPDTYTESVPRLIIHGGAGNITPINLTPERHKEYRDALLTILAQANEYMSTPLSGTAATENLKNGEEAGSNVEYPSALDIATHAVVLLENNPLFNSGHGAVFTRDGINELEASVMVSRGYKKRAVGVMGLRRVKNPILLAKAMLEHGEEDLRGDNGEHRGPICARQNPELNVPSAQGHTLVFGQAAEQLARSYRLELVAADYFFTKERWSEHIRALERERKGETTTATWHPDEYLPQGTCGAVALDRDGVVCCATSTGGMTNKLTGRIGDTPVAGAGFWAENFSKRGVPAWALQSMKSPPKQGFGRQCDANKAGPDPGNHAFDHLVTMVDMGLSGTGNGDSFLRLSAARQVGAITRYRADSTLTAVKEVTGPGGELEKSAGKRWGKTGEGEGGMIAIENEVIRDMEGREVAKSYKIVHEYNCGGMFRAWLDNDGNAFFRVWREGIEEDENFQHNGEGNAENISEWLARTG